MSTNSSNYSVGQTATITVTLLSGSSPDGGASVTVSITKPNGNKASLSGTTGTNGTAVLTYRLGRKAALGTYLVQATTSSTGNAATIGASTSFVVQ